MIFYSFKKTQLAFLASIRILLPCAPFMPYKGKPKQVIYFYVEAFTPHHHCFVLYRVGIRNLKFYFGPEFI